MFKRLLFAVGCMFSFCTGDCMVSHETFLENALSETYKTRWATVRDAKQWAIDAFEKGVGSTTTVEKAVCELITATKSIFQTTTSQGKADFIAVLWSANGMLSPYNCIASTCCLDEIRSVAATNYDMALFLLSSQATGDTVVDETTVNITFSPKFNQEIVGAAIHMLKAERNGHSKLAKAILAKLAADSYPPIIRRFAKD